jgi:hypothetical protein
MNQDPSLKEQIVGTYKEIKEIKRQEEALKVRAWIVINFIVGFPLVIQILIRPAFESAINVVKCGQPIEQCLEVLLRPNE